MLSVLGTLPLLWLRPKFTPLVEFFLTLAVSRCCTALPDAHTPLSLGCYLQMHLSLPLRTGTSLLIFLFSGLRTGSGWTEASNGKSNYIQHTCEIIHGVIDCFRFLPRMEILLIIQIGQLRNHNLLALYRAENAITIETITMPACEQAI